MSEQKIPLPVLLVQPGSVSRDDIERAERLGFICIIECADPEAARFTQPPLTANIDDQSRAALELARYLVYSCKEAQPYKSDLVKLFAQALMRGGASPTPVPPPTATKK